MTETVHNKDFENGTRPSERGIFGIHASIESRIINDHDILMRKIDACRELGQRIVLTSGSFDMAHIGHARYLEAAKSFGDILVVGVDSDAKVKQRKGDSRPVVPETERQELMAHLKAVDLVTIKEPDEPRWELIKRIRPDTLIVTKETYDEGTLEELRAFCGQVISLAPQATTSTSAQIRNLEIGWGVQVKDPIEDELREAGVSEELRRKVANHLIRNYGPQQG